MTKQDRDRIAELEEEIATLREALTFLAWSKVTEERFAYFDWLVKNQVLGDRQERFNAVMTILSVRLAGDAFPTRKPVPGVTTELLYQDGPPSYRDVETLLLPTLDTANTETLGELFEAMKARGGHASLVAVWESAQGVT